MPAFDIFEDNFTHNPFQKYSNRLFNCSVVGANQIRRLAISEMPHTTWIRILFEHIFFYIVITEEIGLFGESDERKERLIEGLIEVVVPAALNFIFHDTLEAKRVDRSVKAEVILRKRLAEYEQMSRVLPAKGIAKLSQTSLGAFCVNVSKIAGEPNDPTHMSITRTHIHDSIEILNMDIFTAMVS